MMDMMMIPCQRQQLNPTGGMTDTIFPEIDELLRDSTELQDAMQHLAPRRAMERYGSIMDFIFCSIHPQYGAACRRFYNDDGPPLRELLDEIDRLEALYRMIWALHQACDHLAEKRDHVRGWADIVSAASAISLPEAESARQSVVA